MGGIRVSVHVPREAAGPPQAPYQRAFWCHEVNEFVEFLPFWVLEFNHGQKGQGLCSQCPHL